MSAPEGWVKKESKSKPGRFYYFNASTGETLWKLPKRSSSSSSSSGASRKKRRVETVTVSHVLYKHVGSRKPHSWRAPEVAITRTQAEAQTALEAHLVALAKCTDDDARAMLFAELATKHSECSSAKVKEGVARGGKLNPFGPGEMQPPFEKAAFALKGPGAISGVVDSPSGSHIILMHARGVRSK
jgi:NIMA-interacting peptidyl-prolyl cis-trans isomerase 1